MHRRHLAVHQLLRMDDAAAESLADRLVAQADAEQGNPAGKLANRRQRDACLRRRAGARRNDQQGGLQASDLVHGDGVVAEHPDVLSQFAKVLHEVVGKGVVVIDHQQHFLRILSYLPHTTSKVQALSALTSEDATARGGLVAIRASVRPDPRSPVRQTRVARSRSSDRRTGKCASERYTFGLCQRERVLFAKGCSR
jgi:hypothetical protein